MNIREILEKNRDRLVVGKSIVFVKGDIGKWFGIYSGEICSGEGGLEDGLYILTEFPFKKQCIPFPEIRGVAVFSERDYLDLIAHAKRTLQRLGFEISKKPLTQKKPTPRQILQAIKAAELALVNFTTSVEDVC
ncbi:MAG TPA: hypothetical protein VJH94_01220 [Candidatus Paceibacterota bacterium]